VGKKFVPLIYIFTQNERDILEEGNTKNDKKHCHGTHSQEISCYFAMKLRSPCKREAANKREACSPCVFIKQNGGTFAFINR
jgi:hypothetical protein